MAELKPAYLISGDDDAKIDVWRARVRKRADEERGPGGLEAFDAAASDPMEVATALATLTFDPGTRYLLVDQVQCLEARAARAAHGGIWPCCRRRPCSC